MCNTNVSCHDMLAQCMSTYHINHNRLDLYYTWISVTEAFMKQTKNKKLSTFSLLISTSFFTHLLLAMTKKFFSAENCLLSLCKPLFNEFTVLGLMMKTAREDLSATIWSKLIKRGLLGLYLTSVVRFLCMTCRWPLSSIE